MSLQEVYGGIAFYPANMDELHQYLQQQSQRCDELRQKAAENPSPVVDLVIDSLLLI